MSDAAAPSPWTRVLAQALLYAPLAAALRIAIHAGASPYADDPAYALGCLRGLGLELALGLLAALPLAWTRRPGTGRALAGALAALLFFAHAAVGHYQTLFQRFPSWEAVRRLADLGPLAQSTQHDAPAWLLLLEVAVPCTILLLGAPRLARAAERRLGSRARRVGLAALLLLPGVSLAQLPGLAGQAYQGCAGPFVYWLTPRPDVPAPDASDAETLRWLQRLQGVEDRGPPLDLRYPLVPAWEPRARQPNPRSVIFLLLESVSRRELEGSHQGRPLTPQLRRIAEEGVSFARFYGPGERSCQALPALFAGLPVASEQYLMLRAPMPRVHGFPRDLEEAGYATAYFHGSDLSFEQQRSFLRMVGFETLVEPRPEEDAGMVGWGEPDARVYERLQDWIAARRTAEAGPFFATLATISVHHPFPLPPGETAAFPGDALFDRFASCLASADAALGAFYDWYLEHERPRGTVLIVSGDHEPHIRWPGDPYQTSTGQRELRFQLPFVMCGLSPAEEAEARRCTQRSAGQHDLPQTVLGLLGLDSPHAYQGRDLLGPEPWPDPRFLVSIAGEELELFYLRDGDRRWLIHGDDVQVYDTVRDPGFTRDLFAPGPEWERVRAFRRAYLGLSSYLTRKDAYLPPEAAPPRPPVTPPARPLLVSHRGNTLGVGRGPPENSLAALDAAVAAGFAWVEFDVRTTRDHVPVLVHDEELALADGRRVRLPELSLAELQALPLAQPLPTLAQVIARYGDRIGFCLELKPTAEPYQKMRMVRGVLRLLEGLPPEARVIVDSFSYRMLSTVERFAAWPTALDLPQGKVHPRWLDYAARAGLEWIYVDVVWVTGRVVRWAHARGLKVMVYDANDPAELERRLEGERVDGVMCDEAAPWETLLRR